MDRKIKVLVVDDSFLMRKIIADIINSDPALEVVGKAKDGQEALEKISSLDPDVITLDLNLPVVDGIDVLSKVMKDHPTRIIMFSAYTRSGASATMRALELGAVDFIAKPSGEISLGLDKLKEEIITKIKLAADVNIDKYLAQVSGIAMPEVVLSEIVRNLVVIGASTGGPKAIMEIMQGLSENLQACFLVVQHMPKGFTMSFAERISWQSGMRAKEAEEGDELAIGKIYVAPAGYHMTLDRRADGGVRVRLNQDPLVNFVRPSIDVTMFSAAELFGKDCIGVILTGMGKDGAEGSRKIKEAGGTIIIQDEKTSVVWGMPRAVSKEGVVDEVLPISDIPQAIARHINLHHSGALK